jgi:hypothetical protein
MKLIEPLLQQFLPGWLFNRKPDPAHAHRRRFTSTYRRKRQWVKSLWIAAGLLMIIGGASPAFVIALALATTFASFCILDETP